MNGDHTSLLIHSTIVNARVVVRDGQLTTLDLGPLVEWNVTTAWRGNW